MPPNVDTLVEIDWIPASSFDDATLKLDAETSLGNVTLFTESLCSLNVCAGLGGTLFTLDLVLRISNALSGEDVVMVMQIADAVSGQLLLCISVPVHVD